MEQFGYTLVATKPAGTQWVTVDSVEAAMSEADRLAWQPQEVELYIVEGRQDDPQYRQWRSEKRETFAQVLARRRLR